LSDTVDAAIKYGGGSAGVQDTLEMLSLQVDEVERWESSLSNAA
jgi:hypothetical protein